MGVAEAATLGGRDLDSVRSHVSRESLLPCQHKIWALALSSSLPGTKRGELGGFQFERKAERDEALVESVQVKNNAARLRGDGTISLSSVLSDLCPPPIWYYICKNYYDLLSPVFGLKKLRGFREKRPRGLFGFFS